MFYFIYPKNSRVKSNYYICYLLNVSIRKDPICRFESQWLDFIFRWMADEWGVCSKPCGNGTRRRQVYCTELWSGASYRSVMDELCSLPLRHTSRQSCNNVKCPILYGAYCKLFYQYTVRIANCSTIIRYSLQTVLP